MKLVMGVFGCAATASASFNSTLRGSWRGCVLCATAISWQLAIPLGVRTWLGDYDSHLVHCKRPKPLPHYHNYYVFTLE